MEQREDRVLRVPFEDTEVITFIDTKSSSDTILALKQRAKLLGPSFPPGENSEPDTVVSETRQCQLRLQGPRCHIARAMASWSKRAPARTADPVPAPAANLWALTSSKFRSRMELRGSAAMAAPAIPPAIHGARSRLQIREARKSNTQSALSGFTSNNSLT